VDKERGETPMLMQQGTHKLCYSMFSSFLPQRHVGDVQNALHWGGAPAARRIGNSTRLLWETCLHLSLPRGKELSI